jgi:hypothetical protein
VVRSCGIGQGSTGHSTKPNTRLGAGGLGAVAQYQHHHQQGHGACQALMLHVLSAAAERARPRGLPCPISGGVGRTPSTFTPHTHTRASLHTSAGYDVAAGMAAREVGIWGAGPEHTSVQAHSLLPQSGDGRSSVSGPLGGVGSPCDSSLRAASACCACSHGSTVTCVCVDGANG